MTSQSQELVLHTILYVLFSVCIIYPPIEFQRVGFTLEMLFSAFIGVEKDDFVGYHLRRTVLTRFIHCCLSLFYFMYISLVLQETTFTVMPETILQFGAQTSVIISGLVGFVCLRYWWNDFDDHPTVRCLKRYSRNNGDVWREVANTINMEYRNTFNTWSITLTGVNRIVMTSSWILNITNYTLTCAQVSDVSLEAIKADDHLVSHHEQSGGPAQFVNIRVSSIAEHFKPFIIRIRTESFRDLLSKLDKPILVAREVVLKQSLSDRFVQAFSQQIALNGKYDYNQLERLELCLGCSTELANIKLWKQCQDDDPDDVNQEEPPRPRCTQCYCKPMWCDSCMGRIFASKQDPHRPDSWMPGKAQCPTCRAVFCVLDVAFLNTYSTESNREE